MMSAHAAATTTVTDLGLVTTTTTKGTNTTDGSFADLFNFTVGPNAGSILVSTASTFSSYGVSLSSLALYLGTYTTTASLSGLTPIVFSASPVNMDLGNGIVVDTVANKSFALSPAATYTLAVNGTSIGDSRYTSIVQLAPVPEPETYAMLLAGLGVMGFVAKRKKASKKLEENASA
ncbi:PEP-CTERM sorting domain-containing protein [Xylophilus rhododendri]|uniref:PEP-CTERM sorting domain-containing protein n=1 Tax=Xylophilus rhododendri TaxID=2697032 RepID=A0A857JCI9_9BURK|nr:PEP-CTERM sorting domain-containing protein [Xylophilus rhododendri]